MIPSQPTLHCAATPDRDAAVPTRPTGHAAALPASRRGVLRALAGGALSLSVAVSATLAGCASQGPSAHPEDAPVRVMTSGGFASTLDAVVPDYTRAGTTRVETIHGASLGNAPDSIPNRLARGEAADVVILARPALDKLVEQGLVVPGSQVDLVRSDIGVAVRAGAPVPDISTVEAWRRTLLEARSIAYSASASGTYFANEMVQKMGIAEQVLPKSRRIVSERVGTVVARGDAELGLQQVSELLPIEGIRYVGKLPAGVQRTTVFSAGVTTHARNAEGGRALIRYLASPKVYPAIGREGLEPADRR